MEKIVYILGVKINDLTEQELHEKLAEFLNSDSFHTVVTPNPEICLKAGRNESYRDTLNNADIKLPDGVGLKLGAEITGQQLNNRLTGADLTKYLLEQNKKTNIFIINNAKGLSNMALLKQKLEQLYPNITVYGLDVLHIDINKIVQEINQSQSEIVFCTLGAPNQEIILDKIKRHHIVTAKLGLAVGGALDFIIGKQKRAPVWWQEHGLEWFYRLMKQPNRIGRITDATFKFALANFKWKVRMETKMRKNIVAIVKKDNKYLMQRSTRFNSWVFTQGGIDKEENLIDAGKREVEEELGIAPIHLNFIKELPLEFEYRWPKEAQVRGGYLGQKQKILLFEFTGNNDDIRIKDSIEVCDTKWVTKDELEKYFDPRRQGLLGVILPELE